MDADTCLPQVLLLTEPILILFSLYLCLVYSWVLSSCTESIWQIFSKSLIFDFLRLSHRICKRTWIQQWSSRPYVHIPHDRYNNCYVLRLVRTRTLLSPKKRRERIQYPWGPPTPYVLGQCLTSHFSIHFRMDINATSSLGRPLSIRNPTGSFICHDLYFGEFLRAYSKRRSLNVSDICFVDCWLLPISSSISTSC